MSTRTSRLRSPLRALCLCAPAILALALIPTAAAQQTNNIALVCAGADCDLFPFIPDAQKFDNVDDAVLFALDTSNSVDTVQILEGSWPFGFVDINETITIEGIGHPADVIITSDGSGPTFTITADDVVLEGLTITGGVSSGVQINLGSDVVVNRCYVTDNSIDGIVVSGAATAIIANTSCANHSGGAGIRVMTTSGQTEIAHCTFALNDTGLLVDTGGTVQLRNSLFEQNTTNGINVLSAAATVIGGTNYYFDNGTDYGGNPAALPGDMIAPDSGPNLADPAGALWTGQVEPFDSAMMPNPVFSAAEPISDAVAEFVAIDLDGDLRDIPPDAEVGADEGGVGFPGNPGLIFVQFFPEPIGELAVGDLFVVLQFSGYAGGTLISYEDTTTFESPLSDKVVLWPQSLVFDIDDADVPPQTSYNTADVGDYAIPLNVTRVVDNYWIGTNAVPIDSDLRDAQNAGLVELGHAFSGTQIYLDGVADLIVHIGGNRLIGATMQVPQAARQPVIDTHPAEILIDTGAGISPGPLPNGRLITDAGNDVNSANVLAGDPRAGAPPSVAIPAAKLNGEPWPRTQFELIETNPVGRGPSVFYNTGTDFSALPGDNLDHTVTVNFVDPPPVDSAGDPITLIEPSGFQPELAIDFPLPPAVRVTVDELVGTTDNGYLMPRWNLSAGQSKLSQSDAPPFGGGTMTINAGFDVGLSLDGFPQLTATWDLLDGDYTVANNDSDPFRYSVRFAGIDRAFNIPSGDDLLDPLNVWWLVRTRTQLSPFMNTEVDTPSFTWELKRGADTDLENTTEPARPVFAYRFFRSINPQDRNGPYAPLRGGGFVPTTLLTFEGWSLSYTYNRGLPFQWFEQNGFTTIPGLVDSWLLLAVVSIDEAGNVEQLPWNPTTPDVAGPGGMTLLSGTPELYTLQATAGVNWQRFLIRGAGSSLDTGDLNGSVTATFWHDDGDRVIEGDEPFFPQANIIPLPPINRFDPIDSGAFTHRVFGRFDIGYSAPPPTDPLDRYGFIYVIERGDGVLIGSGIYRGPDGVNIGSAPVFAPDNIMSPTNPLSWLGDGERLQPVNYVLKAATWWSPGGVTTPGTVTFDEPAPGTYVIDTTPVNYPFTVAPDVPDFVENKAGPDNQPVKVIEGN